MRGHVERPVADGFTYEGAPDSNRGGLEILRVRGGRDDDYRSFLKFFVPPSQGQIASAELRLTCVDGGNSRDGGDLHRVGDDWAEPTLTWNAMPALEGLPLGNFTGATTGASVTLNVGSAVTGSGTVSFGLRSSDYHSVSYSSRQGDAPPELRLEFYQAFLAHPAADFEANRTSGSVPLTVQFFDTSNGPVDSWAWDLGDGATSDLQNPSHTFVQPGRYAVSLTVANSNGAHAWTGEDLVCVRPRSQGSTWISPHPGQVRPPAGKATNSSRPHVAQCTRRRSTWWGALAPARGGAGRAGRQSMTGEDRCGGLGVAGGVRCRRRPVSTIPGRMSLDSGPKQRTSPWELAIAPPPERWDDWIELDPAAWPERVEKHYALVPTICFNCESACGLVAYVDKQTERITKFEGNPVHPGSRGRTCAKGPATINQIHDPERILRPLKRRGKRGSGEFEEVSWEAALEDIGGRIRRALLEQRNEEVMYHVGRPGEDHFVLRMLQAWGVDGHNSHTNVCSAGARLGYSLWMGADRPSPDYSETQFMLLLSSHLETGHYFNPHAQRIIEAKERGARLAVVDTRLSNTASHAHLWIAPWPGTEAALLLGVARELLARGVVERDFVRRWVNWKEYLEANDGARERTLERFLARLAEDYARFTPEFVAEECKIPADTVPKLADEIARAGRQFSSHLWRNTASGNLGGWQVARALVLLHVLTGSLGTPGGVNPNTWDKLVPRPSANPPPQKGWNERLFPREWPLAHYEMSFLLPHLLREKDQRVDVYFTRVYNPVWTNPDGCSWIELLEDERRIGCHVALTPIWSETAQWADYVLPTGLGAERHDLMSQETHAGTWIGFRQPVLRRFKEQRGETVVLTKDANPGEVWEEAEFWVALTWKIDPDGALGIRKWFESKAKPGTPVSMDEYFGDIFEHSVPGLPEAAKQAQLTPLGYMRRFGAFDVPYAGQERYAHEKAGGLALDDGTAREGFRTESRKLEFFSRTMREWGFAEDAIPRYIRSQVHWSHIDLARKERVLLPTFRLPTLIHTRSGNAKWLQEISHTNPLWVHPEDRAALGLENGQLARVTTRIGYFVVRVWETEGIHPGIVGCSHHVGRWRLHRTVGGQQQASAQVELVRDGSTFLFRHKVPVGPFASSDPDTGRIWWHEAGVNQNLTFPVQPDPASGMHCWHQKVTVEPAHAGDRYADVFVDTAKSRAVYEEWKQLTKPAKGPLRRPLWMNRPLRPVDGAYRMD